MMVFRASRLNYPEIGATSAAVAPLLQLGWVDDRPSVDVDQLQRLLRKAELMHYFRLSRPYEKMQKSALVDMLRRQRPESRPFHAWCDQSSDRLYKLIVAPLCERLRLMFFGNFRQDWTEFVLADLGVFAYEKISSSLQWRAFGTRVHVDAFQQLYWCRQWLDGGLELDKVIAAMPPPVTDCDWLEDRRQKLLFEVGRTCERMAVPGSALAVYSVCTHPGARLRTIRLRERAHEWELARDLCRAAQKNPENETERQQLCRLLPRLHRRLGVADQTPRVISKVPAFDMALDGPSKNHAVEYSVMACLAQQAQGDTAIHYVQNGLVNSLFGLLCWNVIFAPLAGAFFHDFQDRPADLSSGSFYQRRQQKFADCFAELESDRYKATIRRCFAAKAGIQSSFVAWRLLNKSLLESALTCIPAAHLRIWFEWMVRDIRENRAGFPDLVQFWPREKRYRMIEVKGPGDRLQDNQRRLLELCASHRMPVSVCRVRWAPSQQRPLPC